MGFRASKEGISVAAAIVAVIMAIVLLSILVLAFIPMKAVNIDRILTVMPTESTRSLSIQMDQDRGNLNIVFQKMEGAAVQLHSKLTGNVGLLDPDEVMLTDLTSTAEGASLNISCRSNVADKILFNSDVKMTSTLTIDPTYLTGMVIHIGTGSLQMVTTSDTRLLDLKVVIQTGNLGVVLSDGTGLNGTIDIATKVGAVNLDWGNISLGEGSGIVRTTTSTGSVDIICMQRSALASNIEWTAQAEVGSIDLNIAISKDLSGKLSAMTDLGSVEVPTSSGFMMFEKDSRHAVYESLNYAIEEGISFHVEVTGVGSIMADLDQR